MTSRSKVDINYRILDVIDKSELAERIKLDEIAKWYGPEPGCVAKPMLPNTIDDEEDNLPLSSLVKAPRPSSSTSSASGVDGGEKADAEKSEAPPKLSASRPAASTTKGQSPQQHLLCHMPAIPNCIGCDAKRKSSAHRGHYDIQAKDFNDVITLDVKVLRPSEFGHAAATDPTTKDMLIFRDMATSYFCAAPLITHSAEELASVIRSCFGSPRHILADQEFSAAAKLIGASISNNVAADHVGNSLPESAVGMVSSSAKAVLAFSGLPFTYAGQAVASAAFGLSVGLKSGEGKCAYELRFPELDVPQVFAFGQAIRVTQPLDMRKERNPIAPNFVDAVVLAPIVDTRGSIRWNYVEIAKALSPGASSSVMITRASDITVQQGPPVFPFKVEMRPVYQNSSWSTFDG